MKTLTALFGCLILGAALAAQAQTPPAATPEASTGTHRYIIERTFKPGSLDGLDAALKAKVNANNSRYDVHWLMSYANAEKTKTFCVYEAPNEAAIRQAAAANGLPVDSITEVPVTLLPK
jgi:FlaG/FlaF family flagellin (archaellin)